MQDGDYRPASADPIKGLQSFRFSSHPQPHRISADGCDSFWRIGCGAL